MFFSLVSPGPGIIRLARVFRVTRLAKAHRPGRAGPSRAELPLAATRTKKTKNEEDEQKTK